MEKYCPSSGNVCITLVCVRFITGNASRLLDVDELREVLDVGEHGVLLHPELVPGDQEADQLLVEGLYLGQVVVLDQLQLGHIQTGKGASVELKERKEY